MELLETALIPQAEGSLNCKQALSARHSVADGTLSTLMSCAICPPQRDIAAIATRKCSSRPLRLEHTDIVCIYVPRRVTLIYVPRRV